MEILTNNYKRNPNALVHSLYQGVSVLGGSVIALTKKHPTEDRLQRIITPTDGLARGQSGLAAVLVLGGMETTLDEMEYILEARPVLAEGLSDGKDRHARLEGEGACLDCWTRPKLTRRWTCWMRR